MSQDDSIEFGEYQVALPNQQESECWGCREGILNQQGHMNHGGCLYYEEEEKAKEDVIETQSHTGTVEESQEEVELIEEVEEEDT